MVGHLNIRLQNHFGSAVLLMITKLRKQDKRYVYSAIGKNNVNGAVRMLDWLEQNWEQILVICF